MTDLKCIAIVNQRRGVGKTTTALSLGMKLSEKGVRVLLVDLDPQAALSAVCGVSESETGSLAAVLGGSLPGKVRMWDILRDILPDQYCFLAPSDLALAQTELGLIFRLGRENALKLALESVSQNFDLALLDCPASLGLLTINAMNAANALLIPARPEISHLRGLCLLATVIERVKREINPRLENLGIVVTHYNHSLAHHRKSVLAIKASGLPLLPVGIKESIRSTEESDEEIEAAIHVSGDSRAMIHLSDYVSAWLNGNWSKLRSSALESEYNILSMEQENLMD